MARHSFLKTIATASVLCVISLACTGSLTRQSDKTVATASNAGGNIIYGELIIPNNSDYMLIPVGFPVDVNKFREMASGTNFSYESAKGSNIRAYNIIFHPKKNGESHLLLSKNSLIDSFHFIEADNEKGKPKKEFIFFELMSNDSNGDGNFNQKDALIGYLADMSGKNIKQITPENTKIVSWHLDKKLGFMLVKIIKDSDSDREFTEKDETTFIRVSLNKPGIGSDIINPPIRQQINKRLAP